MCDATVQKNNKTVDLVVLNLNGAFQTNKKVFRIKYVRSSFKNKLFTAEYFHNLFLER